MRKHPAGTQSHSFFFPDSPA